MQEETDSVSGHGRSKVAKARAGPDGALFIESIDSSKPLNSTATCLEFLLVSFSQHFGLKPKQAAGLLTQGGKYLAHIIAKGLRGQYEPVVAWYQAVFGNLKHLLALILKEEVNGSINLILSTLRPGFLSRSLEAAQWTCRIFSKLAVDFQERNMSKVAWEVRARQWFASEGGGVDACITACRRFGPDVKSSAISVLVQYGHGNFLEMFTILFRNHLSESLAYLSTVNEFLPDLCEIKAAKQELIAVGIIDFWVDFALKESDGDGRKPVDVRLAAISLLCDLWSRFPAKIEENEETTENILTALKRAARDKSHNLRVSVTQFASTARLFLLLDQFSEDRDSYAPIVYKSLTFSLVENYPVESMREFMLTNFILTFKKNPAIPIGILLDPLLKQMQVSDINTVNVSDFDFFMMIAKHSRLNIKNAIQVLDLLGKFYLSSPGFGRASGIPFVIICTRFIDAVPLQEYLFRFCKYSLKLVVDFEKARKAQAQKKLPKYLSNALAIAGLSEELPEEAISGQRRIMTYDMVSRVVTMGNIGLNIRLKEEVISCSFKIRKEVGRHSKGMMVVLGLFGNAEEILDQAEDAEQKAALGLSTDQSESSISRQRVSFIRSYVGNVQPMMKSTKPSSKMPKRRVMMAIEKAKQKREEKEMKEMVEKDQRERYEEKVKKGLKKQLETMKIISGRTSERAIILSEAPEIPQEPIYFDLSEESSDDQEAVNLILRKYTRVLRFLYKKYSSVGYRKKEHSDFESLLEQLAMITDAEMYKMLKDQGVTQAMLPKEVHTGIFKTYCLRTGREENAKVDYEGYLGLIIQVAMYVFSRPPKDMSVYPPAVSVKALFDLFRTASSENGVSIKFYDEPDPGAGDRDIVRKLNQMLLKDPTAQLPDGYRKVVDKELEVRYAIPDTVLLSDSAKVSLCVMDDLLADLFGLHVLEPMYEFVSIPRARGVLAAPATFQAPTGSVTSGSQPPAVPLATKPIPSFDSEIKYQVTLLTPSYPPDHVLECAKTVDDLIYSVEMKSTVVLSRHRKNGAPIQNKVRLEREMREKQEAIEKEKAEKRRKLRLQMVKEKKKKVEEEKKSKEQAEAEQRKAAEQRKHDRIRKRAEERKREKEAREKEIEQWKKQKADVANGNSTDEAHRKEEEDRRRKTMAEFLSKEKKKLMERNQGKKKERESSLQRLEEESKQKAQLREISKKRLLQKLENDRKKQSEEKTQRDQLTRLLVQPGFSEVFQEYEKSLEAVFVHYCKITTKPDQNPVLATTALQFTGFNKFATQFEIYPQVVTPEFSLGVFRQLTKDRSVVEQPVIALTFDEFKQAILRLAVEGMGKVSEIGGSSETKREFDIDALRGFLAYLMLTPDVKKTQKMLQGLTTQTMMRKEDEALRSPGMKGKVKSLTRLRAADAAE